MTNRNKGKQGSIKAMTMRALALGLTASCLSSCYVEVVQDDGHAYSNRHDITEYKTRLLVDAALIPLALAAESPRMVIDPDAYTTPKARSLRRAAVIETTYAYLFEDLDCAGGGYTTSEAEAETTSDADGFTHVEVTLNAEAFNCVVESDDRLYTINSNLRYNAKGEYDDWENEISDIDTKISGSATVDYRNESITHNNMAVSIFDYSANEFGIHATSRLLLDDGIYIQRTDFTTRSSVHWYLNDNHPHDGTVRIKNGNAWVTLNFERNGLWRDDSAGYRTYWSWSQLGY